MTDSNIPGTEVTETPGLIPETNSDWVNAQDHPAPEYDPASANVDSAVPPNTYVENDGTTGPLPVPPSTTPETVVPPTETGTEWDGTINPPSTGDYAAAVDHLVNDMPQETEGESAHNELMHDPAYAIATHEHQLNKIANLLEELCARVVSIEQKLDQHENDHLTTGSDNPIANYPEVTQHGGAPGLTQ